MGLNGFVDFLGHAPVLRARRMAEWQTLLAHFHRNPRATLENFYKRCGVSACAPESPGLQMERASGDLVFLKTPLLPPRHTPLLLLGAGDDVVAPREVLKDNVTHLQAQGYKAVRLHLLPQGGHGLGARHPEEVARLLKEFIHGLP
jgi:pimeloyl-ACP methyl ester carboxylesterase